ncbi:MAG TPA: hypothetical protein VGQ94_06195 [Terriglobales bacterium]|nr:hypothetical protein [Terriglobales bacterium]
MTLSAERDEIALGVLALLTAEAEVVNFELSSSPAVLAAPAVALEYLLPEAPARIGVQPDRALFWTNAVHEAGLM